MNKAEVLANLERVDIKKRQKGGHRYWIDGKECSMQVTSLIVDNQIDQCHTGKLTRRGPHFSVPSFR